MTGKWNFSGGREDSDAPRVTGLWRKNKRSLGEIELTRDLLHLLLRKALCLRQHRQLISTETRVGEHITDVITVLFHNAFRTGFSPTRKLTKKRTAASLKRVTRHSPLLSLS
jgi:hypothetical protein